MNEKYKNEAQKEKIGIVAWISLVILILVLSGAFRTVDGPLKVLDFTNLSGAFEMCIRDRRPIKCVFAGDEENLHMFSNAKAVMEAEASGALAAFNFETGYLDNHFVVGRNGGGPAQITVHGVDVYKRQDRYFPVWARAERTGFCSIRYPKHPHTQL